MNAWKKEGRKEGRNAWTHERAKERMNAAIDGNQWIDDWMEGIKVSAWKWKNDWMNERMYESRTECMNEWMKWINERMNDWMNERRYEWMSGWMNQ